MASPRLRQPPELMVELIEEILLRVPPDDPAALARASVVCKRWRLLLSDLAFGRRYRGFHGAPPLQGFLYDNDDIKCIPRFVPTVTPSPFPQRAFDDCAIWSVLDCRHGRVLYEVSADLFAVWDPITGERQELPELPVSLVAYSGAVLCAVHGCNHLDCRGGPFFVVLVGYHSVGMQSHLYSSEEGAWNASAHLAPGFNLATRYPSVLIGDDIYFVIIPKHKILKYSLGKNFLSMIHPPAALDGHGGVALMPMEDGSLGLSSVLCSSLCLWSRNADPEVDAGWVQFRAIELGPKTPIPFRHNCSLKVTGSAEGFGVIFVTTDVGAFIIELKSGQARKVGEVSLQYFRIFPFMSFYTPDCASSILPTPEEAHQSLLGKSKYISTRPSS